MALGRVEAAQPGEEFCMTVLALKNVAPRQRRRVAARPRQPGRCGSRLYPGPCRGRGADRPHHQRRPRPRPGWRRRCGSSTTATSGPTGSAAAASRSCGTRSTASTTASCGKRTRSLKAVLIGLRPPPRPRGRPSAAASRETLVAAGPGLQPRRPDDRLRPPLRHLQAGRPDLPGPGADRRA